MFAKLYGKRDLILAISASLNGRASLASMMGIPERIGKASLALWEISSPDF